MPVTKLAAMLTCGHGTETEIDRLQKELQQLKQGKSAAGTRRPPGLSCSCADTAFTEDEAKRSKDQAAGALADDAEDAQRIAELTRQLAATKDEKTAADAEIEKLQKVGRTDPAAPRLSASTTAPAPPLHCLYAACGSQLVAPLLPYSSLFLVRCRL